MTKSVKARIALLALGRTGIVAQVAIAFAVLGCLFAVGCSLPGTDDRTPVARHSPPTSTPPVETTPTPQAQVPVVLPGQSIRFERVSLEQGLSQSTVMSILQDRQGFMWFGTEDGLNKYDGHEFTIYTHDPDDPLALSSDYVRTIYEDQSGTMWIGTRDGLDRFDRATEEFSHFQHDPRDPSTLGGTRVYAILEDHTGMLWIGTADGGLNRLDRETGVFTHFRHDPDVPGSLSNNAVWAIYQDRSGDLWIGTEGGLDRYDRTNETFAHYRHNPEDPQSLSQNKVLAIYEDRQGVLWIGTEEGGLDQFDRSTGTFVHYRHDPDDPDSLGDDVVSVIYQDRVGRLWIGTRHGLERLVRGAASERVVFRHYRHDPNDPHSLSYDSVRSLYQDRSGVLWIGTLGGGLSKYTGATDRFALYRRRPGLPVDTPDPSSLSDNIVWSIHEDSHGALWVGTFRGGLNRLDRESGTWTVYRHDPADPTSLSNDDVRAIYEDRFGTLWVGTNFGGLNRLDPKTEEFIHYRHDPEDPTSLSDNDVFALFEDRVGNLWIGTWYAGLNRLDRETETFVHYPHVEDDPSSLVDHCVRTIYEDRQGLLWVGTRGGISIWDPINERFTNYVHDPDDPRSLGKGSVLSFSEDESGTMWVATYGGGLGRYDRDTGTFTRFIEKHGLPNDGVYGILADAEGYLWISTNKGLAKFDPRTETFHNYDVSDGLQSNEFNSGAYFRSDRGEMFFGGIEGFNAFYPERVKPRPEAPPIVITDLSTSNQTLRTDLSPDEHIELAFRDNFVSFEFAALDYTAPEKNRYAYKMEGLDEVWVYAGARRHADYPNLRWGDHVFRVKGSNSDGVWNDEGTAVRIIVETPVWATWWFRGFVGLALAMGAVGTYRLRIRSIQARSRELEGLVEERTREIEQSRQELEALYRADEELYRHLRLDRVLQAFVDIAVDILGMDKSALFVWDERRKRLVVRVARGFDPDIMEQLSFPPDEGVVGFAFTTGEPIIVEDTHLDDRIATRISEPEGIRSLMHVPVKIGGEVFGVFNVDYHHPRAFGEHEQRLCIALAQRAALAIEKAQLYETAEEAMGAAKEANRAKSVFLANMSHELRTPLNAILGFAQLMARDYGLTDEQRENLRTIGRSGEHLLGLINDVLELSKIEAGRTTLQEGSFDLHRLLLGLEEMFRLRATEKRLLLAFYRAPDVPRYVWADEGKLRQVLMNVLGNAIKYTQKGGITLRVGSTDLVPQEHAADEAKESSARLDSAPGCTLHFEVADTGPGIAEEEWDAVFEPFRQTSTGEESREGTGLGMAISRQFVRLMGGDITFRSELGVGTVFEFDLPVKLAEVVDVPTSQPERQVVGLAPGQYAPDGGTYRLLVAEDHEANRRLLTQLLQTLGFEVREVTNGREAIELWSDWKPHLIWMDVRMPVMDGNEAVQRIKATAQGQSTVVIALTAAAFEEDRAALLSAGCDDYLRKPFREKEIVDMLTKHLGVRFIYEGSVDDGGIATEVLSAAALAALPAKWVTELGQAALQADAELVLGLIDQIRDKDAPLADVLTSLVRDFRFDTLASLALPTLDGEE